MRITKVFNNNAIATKDSDQEVILLGSGIGFRKHVGDLVDESRIEKRYELKDGQKNPLYQLLLTTPTVVVQLAQKIIDYATKETGICFSEHVLVPLTDHINFAIERYNQGIELPNLFLDEVRILYPSEFQIGINSLKIIKDELNIQLPEDEAGYIALHLIDGLTQSKASATLDIFRIVDGCVNVIEESLGIHFDQDSYSYVRLLTHLKYLAVRFTSNDQQLGNVQVEIPDFLLGENEQIGNAVKNVQSYLKSEYNYDLSEAEKFYLMVHLHQICTRRKR